MDYLPLYITFFCGLAVQGAELPRIPGSITTLRETSEEVYMPASLFRSRYPSDGPNAFLLADSSAMVKMSGPVGEKTNYTITQLAGHPVITGYNDGPAHESRFFHIGDFAQSEDGRKVYIADKDNHCIRLFDREWANVTEFAGNCTEFGSHIGKRLDARFSSPSGVTMSANWDQLYVADRQNNRILRIELTSEENWVHRVVDSLYPQQSRVLLPTSIAMSSTGLELYLTTENGLIRLTEFGENSTAPIRYNFNTNSNRPNMLGLQLLGDRYAVVTDNYGNSLVFVDLVNEGAGQICTGQLTKPQVRVDGPSSSCEMNSPHGVAAISAGELFITEYSSRVIRRVSYRLPPAGLTTTEPPITTQFVTSTTEMPDEDLFNPVNRKKASTEEPDSDRSLWKDSRLWTTTLAPSKGSPLVLGLSVGILIPLVLIGVLVSLISYIRIQAQRQARLMYARRTEQGGYNGPGYEPRFPSSPRPSTSSIPDQPPSYVPTHPYSTAPVHDAASSSNC